MKAKNTGLPPLPTYLEVCDKLDEGVEALTPIESMVLECEPMAGDEEWREQLHAALQQAFDEGMAVAAQARAALSQRKPIASLHITSTDTYPDIEVEVHEGALLQPSMSPIKVYADPAGALIKFNEQKKFPLSTEPLFWYRPRSDGLYEGPINNASIEGVRKASGAWIPLYAAPQASADAELRAAYNEWHDKTAFIQEWIQSGKLPVKYLGWHRADVMRDLIEQATPAPQPADAAMAALAAQVPHKDKGEA